MRPSPLPFALGAASALVGIVQLYTAILGICHGAFTYPLDDSYIHMALARNLVETGTWGVQPGEFSTSSSSPGWALSLGAGFGLTGGSAWVPLALNVLVALGCVGVFAGWTHRRQASTPVATLAVLAGVWLAPLPALAVQGMEHVLQVLTTAGLLFGGAELVVNPGRRRLLGVGALGMAACAVRYEALFLAAVLGTLLATRRRFGEGAVIIVFAALAPLGFAAVSMSHGWHALPVALLLSGTEPWTGTGRGARILETVGSAGWMIPIVLNLCALWRRPTEASRVGSLLFIGTALLHACFSRSNPDVYRYDAYLVAIGTLVGLVGWFGGPARARIGGPARALRKQDGHKSLEGRDSEPGWPVPAPFQVEGGGPGVFDGPSHSTGRIGAAVAVLLLTPLAHRAWTIHQKSPLAASDVQTFAMASAQLLVDVMPQQTVAVSWLGCISWLGGVRTLDLDGLGNLDAANLYLSPRNPGDLGALLQREGVQAAMLGPHWFSIRGFDGPPDDWRLVATWMVQGKYSGWVLTNGIWAAGDADALREKIRAKIPSVPAEVVLIMEEGVVVAPENPAGAAVGVDGGRVTFYTNGSVQFRSAVGGRMELTLSATMAEDRAAVVEVEIAGRRETLEVHPRARTVDLGRVVAGEVLTIAYADDVVDALGRDRNVVVWGVRVILTPPAPPPQTPRP